LASKTALTALTSDSGTQLAAKFRVLSCSILRFTLLPPVLELSLLSVGCWQNHKFTVLMGKGFLPHQVHPLNIIAANNFGAFTLVGTSYRFKSKKAAA